jgi:hypothetical protein
VGAGLEAEAARSLNPYLLRDRVAWGTPLNVPSPFWWRKPMNTKLLTWTQCPGESRVTPNTENIRTGYVRLTDWDYS